MPENHELVAVQEGAEKIFEASDVADAYDRMALRITDEIAGTTPVVLCVMVGGLIPTAELIRRFDFPLELDYLHATRYRGETSGGDLVWKVSPSTNLADRTVLVVDDILDEGHTLAAVLQALRAQQPRRLLTAALLEKRHQRRVPGLQADFVGLEAPDRYVFGCGMDYKGYWRQLDGIYALAEGGQ